MLNTSYTGLENLKVSCGGSFFIDYRVKECVTGDFVIQINSTFSQR